jgi:peptide/nickel transport system ATP-binding protein
VSHRLAVMYAGRFVETGPVAAVARQPRHPYTEGLLNSTVHEVPRGTRLTPISGSPPNLTRLPPGCSFAPRCSYVIPQCMHALPELRGVGAGSQPHLARCLRSELVGLKRAVSA